MRRAFWLVVLGLGAVAGFASGFHSVRHHGHGPDGVFNEGCWRGQWQAGRARHVQELAAACVEAAREQAAPKAPPGAVVQ
jgi:hypothetical protein